MLRLLSRVIFPYLGGWCPPAPPPDVSTVPPLDEPCPVCGHIDGHGERTHYGGYAGPVPLVTCQAVGCDCDGTEYVPLSQFLLKVTS